MYRNQSTTLIEESLEVLDKLSLKLYTENIITALESALCRKHNMRRITNNGYDIIFMCQDCEMELEISRFERPFISGEATQLVCLNKEL